MSTGVAWVGIRTDAVTETAALLREALGLSARLESDDFVVLDAPNGDRVELFGPNGPQPPHQFERNAVVVGFAVPDIEAARARLETVGAELLGRLEGPPGAQWQHFRGPDSLVYELTERSSGDLDR